MTKAGLILILVRYLIDMEHTLAQNSDKMSLESGAKKLESVYFILSLVWQTDILPSGIRATRNSVLLRKLLRRTLIAIAYS